MKMDLEWIIPNEIKQEEPAEFYLISATQGEELNVAFDKYATDVEIAEIARTQIKQELPEHTELVSGRCTEYINDTVKETLKTNTEDKRASYKDWSYRKKKKKTKSQSKPKLKPLDTSVVGDITSITTTGPPYICNICLLIFPLKKSLEAHSSIHKGKNFQCDICRKVYPTKESVHSHMKTHMEKRYSCSICFKAFALKKSFKHHQLVHEEKKFRCEICSKLFRQKEHVRQHVKIHRERTRGYKCEICESAFYEQRTLNRHMKNVHSTTVRQKFRCPNALCDKYYSSPLSFKMHACVDGRRPQNLLKKVCPLCGKRFNNQFELNKHTARSHTIDRPKNFECHRCNKLFNYRYFSAYILHVVQNCAKSIVYTCHYCAQVVPSRTKLMNHFVYAHNIRCTDKAHSCPTCSKLFFGKKNLINHLKNNHIEFKCKHCNKTIRSKSSLTLHQNRCIPRIEVKSELYECDICADSFVQETHLLGHMTEIHSEQNLRLELKEEPYC